LKILVKWQRFSRLPGFERGIVIEALAALIATWLGLRLAGFRRWKSVLAWLAATERDENGTPAGIDCAQVILRMESAAARNLFFLPNCLERSMVLWWLLMNRGIAAELHVGARKDAERFEAHAWVECGGTVLNDAEETHLHFVPFDGPIASVETPVN
jgi:hypothetical protein